MTKVTGRGVARRRVTLWSLRLAAAAGVLLAAEGAVRLALRAGGGAWPRTAAVVQFENRERVLALYRRHPFLNVGPRGGAAIEVVGKRAAFNSLGYRSPERPREKPPGAVRVLCSGGSTTFDLLADEDEASWPWRLEARLAAAGGEIEVWNGGFPGWTSLENAISFLLRDRDLDPDVAILYQGINDLQPAAHEPFDRHYVEGHAERLVEALGFGLPRPGWLERSVLLEAVSGRRGRPPARTPPPRGADREIADAAPEVFARNLRSYLALARGAGARPILATQPLRLRAARRAADLEYLGEWLRPLDPEAAPAQLERLNDVVRRIAREEGVPLADVAREVAFDDADFVDPMHYSAAGSDRLAAFFAPRVAALVREIAAGAGGAPGGGDRRLPGPPPGPPR